MASAARRVLRAEPRLSIAESAKPRTMPRTYKWLAVLSLSMLVLKLAGLSAIMLSPVLGWAVLKEECVALLLLLLLLRPLLLLLLR